MTSRRRQSAALPSAGDAWRDLTWDDLEAWADGRSLERGRSYQRSGRVRQLARADDGALLAWVSGQSRYATEVRREPGDDGARLSSRCNCPLGISGCKHAVAVVLDYLDALQKGRGVPAAGGDDPRRALLNDDAEAGEPGDDGGEAWGDVEGDWGEEQAPPRRARRRGHGKARRKEVRAYLEGLPAADLASYILGLADRYPEVADELANRSALAHGKMGELVRQARKEITRLTAQEVWYNPWQGEGNLPDYDHLRERLEQLLAHGEADAVVGLGRTLFDGAHEQIGSANDEGETASGVARCLDVVFRALLASGRTDVEKLLYAFDLDLRDEYEICQGANAVFEKEWPPAAWSAAADELRRRLNDMPGARWGEDFSEKYRRDRLSDALIDCLRRAGRGAEVLPLCEEEAEATGSYERLVNELIAARRREEAKRRALEGIERVGAKWPGIAKHLQDRLREMAERDKDWPAVAAMHAEAFFEYPSVEGLERLQRAADKARCGPAVRAAALHFLETGTRPGGKKAPPWPLPAAAGRAPRPERPGRDAAEGPHLDVLLDLAIHEKRPDDVLKWYDALTGSRKPRGYGWGGDNRAVGVADAVRDAHPDRALALYKSAAESEIDRTSPSAYEAALPHLRKARDLLHRLGRDAEWQAYLAALRDKNRRKRRLMEALDRLERRRIVDA